MSSIVAGYVTNGGGNVIHSVNLQAKNGKAFCLGC